MKVLLSLRSDALKVFGGDTVYTQKIAEVVRKRGVTVVLSDEHPPKLRDIDLVNVINVVNLSEVTRTVERAKAQGIPVILTPEYYNLDRFFLHTHWKANVARLTLGESAGLALFRLKKQLSHPWKALRKLMQEVDHVVAKSEREKRQLIVDFDLPASKISIVPNGVDPRFGSGASPTAFTKRYGIKDFLLTVGRVEPIKNQLSLLKATRGLDIPLVFIGGGYTASNTYLDECRKLARGRPVHFIDRLPHDEMAGALAAARAHVAPSYNETTSLVSLEAILCGCPVVVTKESPYAEYFGSDVLTCDPYDVASIRAAVEKILKRPPPVAKIRQRLIREFTWERIGRELAKVYQEVAK